MSRRKKGSSVKGEKHFLQATTDHYCKVLPKDLEIVKEQNILLTLRTPNM